MTSISSFGASLITLQFVLDKNIDVAEQDVQAAINAATTFLPAILPNPPIYNKVNPADTPVMTLAHSPPTLCLSPRWRIFADTNLAQKISQAVGSGAGNDQRRTEAGRAGAGESDSTRILRA